MATEREREERTKVLIVEKMHLESLERTLVARTLNRRTDKTEKDKVEASGFKRATTCKQDRAWRIEDDGA